MSTLTPPAGRTGCAPAAKTPANSSLASNRTDTVSVAPARRREDGAAGALPVLGHPTGRSSRFIGRNGAQILLQMLLEHGVTDAFG